MRAAYYADKLESLRSVFDGAVELTDDEVVVDGRRLPILDDVIIALDAAQWPASLRTKLATHRDASPEHRDDFAPDIQSTFGAEWTLFNSLLPDHEEWFRSYFDLVRLESLSDKRLCDLGCGMGRWSYFASKYCREITLVDFSDAIFVARQTLRERRNAIFVMADIRRLPFRRDCADLIFSLGVLHHLPTPALEEVIRLKEYAPQLLVYLYYALDNRPAFFRMLLTLVTTLRSRLSRVHSDRARAVWTTMIAASVYRPLVGIGMMLRPVGLARHVPLYEAYRNMSWVATKQDVYDRFFTRIEQRYSRSEIKALERHFHRVTVSQQLPFWHFLCER